MMVKFAARPRLCAVLLVASKQAANLSVRQNGGRPSTGISELLDTEADIADIRTNIQKQLL
jgi:hypothetical protein